MHKDNRIFEKKSHRTKLIRSNHQLILNPDSQFSVLSVAVYCVLSVPIIG